LSLAGMVYLLGCSYFLLGTVLGSLSEPYCGSGASFLRVGCSAILVVDFPL